MLCLYVLEVRLLRLSEGNWECLVDRSKTFNLCVIFSGQARIIP